uniref:Uncharacterized protein n=1 Tax=Parascaris equorum TaxID=6256 RepID=A0A914RQ41_PAREQ
MNDASMFYVNRVRNEHKNGDKMFYNLYRFWIELAASVIAFPLLVFTVEDSLGMDKELG